MVTLLPRLPWPFSLALPPPSPSPAPSPTADERTVEQPANHKPDTLSGKRQEAKDGAASLARYVALLEPYAKEAGGKLPRGSRAAPEVQQLAEGGLSWKLWKAAPFFIGNGMCLWVNCLQRYH